MHIQGVVYEKNLCEYKPNSNTSMNMFHKDYVGQVHRVVCENFVLKIRWNHSSHQEQQTLHIMDRRLSNQHFIIFIIH